MKTEEKAVRKYRQSKVYSAKEKCRAVLAVWSGRRTPSSLCKEMSINWGALNGWEKSGLEGILLALDPGWKRENRDGIALGKRIEDLLSKTVQVEPQQEDSQN
jgi:hypothetical protein